MNHAPRQGLSILIPIYNFDCRSLIEELYNQCRATNFPFEIVALEDASAPKFRLLNGSLKSKASEIKYQYLEQNVGRSRIRNLLAQKAKFDYLLFMDGDSKVVHPNYIQTYLQHLKPSKLLYGGRIYQNAPPENQQFILHWKFGKQREESSAVERSQQPYHSFMTNNFVIPKPLFQNIQFDENLKQYGHEDTLFGLELKARNIPILHLDNPLEHIGLEETTVFLSKTDKAIENLVQLHLQGKPIETKLLNTYLKLKKYHLQKVYLFSYCLFRALIRRNLFSRSSWLFCFDLYKLNQLTKIMKHFRE
ncbi:MAG: glycosyltransferase [Bacteroidota bacterium]